MISTSPSTGEPQRLVSVVIPNFNYARFVGAAIRSVLAQTYAPIEIIVVDDGSTDDSRDVIAAFEPAVRLLTQPNRGQMATNNAGYAASSGDIVFFLDADDALHPDAVARVVEAMKPGVSAVQFCLSTIDQDDAPLGGIYPPLPPDWTPERIRRTAEESGFYPFPPTSGNAYPRWFLEQVMPIDAARCPRATDGALNGVAPFYGDVIALREPLAFYRIHGSNMGALEELAPDKFTYFVELDRQRGEVVLEHAARRGVPVPHDFLDRAFFHLQYRLASLKLRPEAHPYKDDRIWRVAGMLMRAAWRAPEKKLSRVLVAVWTVAVAAAPRRLAERLVASRFIAGKRPALLDAVLRELGLVRRTKRRELRVATAAE